MKAIVLGNVEHSVHGAIRPYTWGKQPWGVQCCMAIVGWMIMSAGWHRVLHHAIHKTTTLHPCSTPDQLSSPLIVGVVEALFKWKPLFNMAAHKARRQVAVAVGFREPQPHAAGKHRPWGHEQHRPHRLRCHACCDRPSKWWSQRA